MPAAAGKSGCDQRDGEGCSTRDPDLLSGQVCAGAFLGRKQFIACGIVHYSRDQLPRAFECECYVVNRKSVSKVGSAVQRIDIPGALRAGLVPTAFLSDDVVTRIG